VTVDTGLNHSLLEVLRAATGRPDLAYDREPVRLTGGFWAELLAFSLADPPHGWPREVVARVMPDAALARKETIMQAAVSAAGFPTPAVRASCGPDNSIGRALMVMDRAAGAPLLPGLSGAGAVAAGLRQAAAIPEALASAMAALHALDPEPVRSQLAGSGGLPVTLAGMLALFADMAARYRRDDLARAASWLIDHPRPPQPAVICHGDLHPFNVLADGSTYTVLDWSASLLAPRAYDVAFTVSMLSEPPLRLPGPLRSAVRGAGRALARRFVRRYEAHSGSPIGRDDVRWHRAAVSVRALTEIAGWMHDGVIAERAGHPWLVCGPALAGHLTAVTGIAVRPR
jgi:aminoglycoside phosphotransferase (APT) family kinase protein